MEALLNQLNPPQQQAVRTIEGPVLVLAGAGTGKTRVITYRIAYMISQEINPKSILGMTFTNKAAKEMRERLAELVPTKQAEQVTLGTFHSFCVKLLRHEIKLLNFLPSFTIADETDMQGLMKQAMAAKGFTKDDISMNDVASYIGQQKNQLIFPPESKKQAENDYVYDMAQIYEEYQNLLELQNMIDFDDMLMLSYKILTKFPEVLEKYRARYQYLLVDEYQDTNDAQFELIRLLAEPRCNLCVVGDDDQSIYGWRGANVGNILDFPKRFPGAAEIRLEQNYRSTNNILMAANRVISRNTNRFSKSLWSAGGEGDKITLVRTNNAEEEADMIANYIAGTHGENPNIKYSSFAILYRSNHLSRQLEQSLRTTGVPYRLVGGQEFFKRKEIKDAAAYLKLLANPRDDQSLLRILPIPPRGLAEKA
ncbi:MAG: UvrD-helicase domain-containing protein, partial [Victivallaceae bacterium]